MKVEVRNVKEAKFASEETMCFQATVVVDGKVMGTVSNDGHGGGNNYDGVGSNRWRFEAMLKEWAKTLPPFKDFEGEMMAHDVDTAIDDLVHEFLTRRDLDRKLKGHVVLKKADGKLYTVKLAKGIDTKAYAAKYVGRDGVVKVLNLLPPEEALAEWKAVAS